MSLSYTPKAGIIPIVVIKPHGEHLLSAAQKVKTDVVVVDDFAAAKSICLPSQGAVVLLQLAQPSLVPAYLGFLKEVRPALAQNRLRIVIVLGFPENEVLRKMGEYGFSESVRDPVPEKSLLFKLEKTHRQLLQLTHSLGLPGQKAPTVAEPVAPPVIAPRSTDAVPTATPVVPASIEQAQTVGGVAFDPKLSAISIGYLISELMSLPQVLDRNSSGIKTGVQVIAQRACDFLRDSCDRKSRFEVWILRAQEWVRVTEEGFTGPAKRPELPAEFPRVEIDLLFHAPEIKSRAALIHESSCPLGKDYLQHSLEFLRGVLLEEFLETA